MKRVAEGCSDSVPDQAFDAFAGFAHLWILEDALHMLVFQDTDVGEQCALDNKARRGITHTEGGKALSRIHKAGGGLFDMDCGVDLGNYANVEIFAFFSISPFMKATKASTLSFSSVIPPAIA